jgi:ribosomal protein S13
MDIVDFVLTFIVCTIGFFVILLACFFIYGFASAFYKVVIKKQPVVKYVKAEDLTEEQKKQILDKLAEDDSNWINLHVETLGDMVYFYDGDAETGKFLFQCKSYEEMVENLNRIRGHRGVRIPAELVVKLEMEDFFVKPGTKLVSRPKENK